MDIRTVLVCAAQVPLSHGGAEILAEQLVGQLRLRGYLADLVRLPFKWYPHEALFEHAAAWRLIDLTESGGQRIDRVIATKFPSYFVRHPEKSIWLVHQHRAAYDLCGTPFCNDFDWTEMDVAARERLIALDTQMIGEARRVYTIGSVTTARLQRYNGITAPPLHHPPKLAGRLRTGPQGDYLLSVGRLETLKRVDLAIRAIGRTRGLRLVVVGEGSQRETLDRLVEEAGATDRVDFRGAVDDEELIGLYANALGVLFAPFDEDYGYVTLEAFLSAKPVVTCRDSGGVLEFVSDGVNGRVTEPDPSALADALQALAADRGRAAAMGDAGRELARRITWDGVIEKLLGV